MLVQAHIIYRGQLGYTLFYFVLQVYSELTDIGYWVVLVQVAVQEIGPHFFCYSELNGVVRCSQCLVVEVDIVEFLDANNVLNILNAKKYSEHCHARYDQSDDFSLLQHVCRNNTRCLDIKERLIVAVLGHGRVGRIHDPLEVDLAALLPVAVPLHVCFYPLDHGLVHVVRAALVVALLDDLPEGALCAKPEEFELVGDDAEDSVARIQHHVLAALELHALELDALVLAGHVGPAQVTEHGLQDHAVFELVSVGVNVEDGRVDQRDEGEHLHDEGRDVEEGFDAEAGDEELFFESLLQGLKIGFIIAAIINIDNGLYKTLPLTPPLLNPVLDLAAAKALIDVAPVHCLLEWVQLSQLFYADFYLEGSHVLAWLGLVSHVK